MKYDYEYKRKAVEKYRKGELMKTLEGANETNFRKMIRKWVQLEYACNPEVLKQKINTKNGVPKNATNWWQRYLPENQSSR